MPATSQPRLWVARPVAESRAQSRFGALDGYRALAALAVVVSHAAAEAGLVRQGGEEAVALRYIGNVGVAVFFVLSGFLLYRPYAAAHLDGTPARPLRVHLRHRLLRIFPAYWVVVMASLVLVDRAGEQTNSLFSVLTLTDIYQPSFYMRATVLGVAWTLTVELAFYLFLPLFAAVVRRVRGSRQRRLRAELVALVGLAVFGIAYRFAVLSDLVRLGPNETAWLPNFFDWFALGMAAGVAVAWRDGGGRLPGWLCGLADRWLVCWLCAGWGYVVLSAVGAVATYPFQRGELPAVSFVRYQLGGVLAALLLLPALLGTPGRSRIDGWLRTPVMVWLGTVSYGIYLWHLVLMEWLVGVSGIRAFWSLLVLTLILTLPAAAVSWYALERPLLRLKDGWPRRRRPSSPATTAAARPSPS